MIVAPSICRRRWLDAGIDAAGAAGAARRELVFRAHRFPAQLCEQDFDAYEEAVISDDTMQAVGAGILDESPRSADPRR